jgi:hypothetical protein
LYAIGIGQSGGEVKQDKLPVEHEVKGWRKLRVRKGKVQAFQTGFQ